MKAVYKHKEIQLTAEVWKEGALYVSYIPQLDISSCGETVDEARKNIREATELFIEGLEENGTLAEVLEEAGFAMDDDWKAPELVAFEKMKLVLWEDMPKLSPVDYKRLIYIFEKEGMSRERYFELMDRC